MRARGRRPSSLACAAVIEQHRGGAVGDLRRRARGVHAVLAGDRLQRRRASRATSRAGLRRGRRGGSCRWACRRRRGRARRSATHLALEPALAPTRAAARCCDSSPKLVAVGAGDAPLVGDALGALELRDVPRSARSTTSASGRPGPLWTAAPSGTRLIDSTPHAERDVDDAAPRRARPRGSSPAATSRTARRPWSPATLDRAGPAASHAVRAMLKVCSPIWVTQPPTTWPTAAGSMPRALDRGASGRRRAGRRGARSRGRRCGARAASGRLRR